MNALGEKIRALREERGLKQAELANIVKVKAARISHWEMGRRRVSLSDAAKLALAFGVPVGDLVASALDAEKELEVA